MSVGDSVHVRSAFEGKRLTVTEHLGVSSFWFGSNVLWSAFLALVLPYEIGLIKPEDKAVYLGRLLAIGAIFALAVPLLVGPLSDRCRSKWGRRRPYIAAGLVLTMIGLPLMYFAAKALSFPLYLAGYLVIQLGNNISTGAYSGVIPDVVPPDQRGIASGFMGFMSQFGSALGLAVCALLLLNKQIAAVYGFLFVALALSGLWTLLAVKEHPLEGELAPFSWKTYLKSLWIDPRKFPDFAWVWLTRALVMLGFYSVQPWLFYYLQDVVGIHDKVEFYALILFVSVLVAASITGIYGGHVSERAGRKRVVYLANSLMAVTAILFAVVRSFPAVVVVGVIFGLGYGAYVSVDWALGTDVLPSKKDAGKDMAVWHIAMTLPQTIAPPIAGLALAAFGKTQSVGPKGDLVTHYAVPGYVAIFLAAAVFLTLGAVGLRNVRGVR